MKLDSPKKQYEVLLTAAKSTTDMDVCVSFDDNPAGIVGSYDTKTNGTTAVPICFGPNASVVRSVRSMTIANTDTAAKTLTMRLNNNGTYRTIASWVMQVGDVLAYEAGGGLYLSDASGQRKTISAPLVAVTGSTTITSATSPDIFGAAGATVSINNSPPVTMTSIADCTAAQVGSVKRVIPVQNWNVTASASLVVDGETSGPFVMPAGAKLDVLATSTTTFSITTIFASGTWTPTFTGLTLGGSAPTLTGMWVKVGRVATFNVVLTSAGGGNTTACVAGASYVNNVPLTASVRSSLGAISDHTTLIGSAGGTINANQFYPPAWTATINGKDISWQAII